MHPNILVAFQTCPPGEMLVPCEIDVENRIKKRKKAEEKKWVHFHFIPVIISYMVSNLEYNLSIFKVLPLPLA